MAKQELKILIGIHRMANAIDRKTSRLLQPYQLTLGQFAVLEALYHKGDMAVGQVQEKILSSSGTIPLIIQNLETRGLLVRLKDEADRRRCILQLTEPGRALIEEVYPQNESMILNEFQIYSEEEKAELTSLLKKYKGENDG
ncbi:MarR family winged helix-turn-helix transcriptional regulator [Luxibacter massiliensis]|uniref:MarR family winged helix-turn-helix transcriptional regulator n=1 Tax=Luxibacter massiliensis TaxID=2219695 RepID=UPI000F061C8B|nr:MarR family transcriptional regulator [Luxibacter massiliensis]